MDSLLPSSQWEMCLCVLLGTGSAFLGRLSPSILRTSRLPAWSLSSWSLEAKAAALLPLPERQPLRIRSRSLTSKGLELGILDLPLATE